MKVRTAIGWMAAAGWLMLAVSPEGQANNIRVANVASRNQDVGAKTVYVSFDLSWENSWRGAENWDAAWVFVKFRAPGSNNWQHATLSTQSGKHTPAANSTIAAVSDGKGVFIYRSSGYTGNVNYASTRLLWNYGSNGYSFAQGALVEISVHAIEMVYISQGAFCLGSGGTETGHFYQYTDGTQSTNPYVVSSETAITTSTNISGDLWGTGGTSGDRAVAPSNGSVISNAFPKGYAAFYCMKYEISQGQWVEFFNKLTYAQQTNRDITGSTGKKKDNEVYRNTVAWTNAGDAWCTTPDRACNYLSWGDVIAYADWAALRPMTELEFEKACRGPANPVTNEYAWGSTVITNLTGEAGTPGSGMETPNPATANCCGAGGFGPTRVGIFATATSGRQGAGAGYYGVMELSGNVWERCVTVGKPEGRVFQGTLGDGVLDASGNATGNTDWPAGSTALGAGCRGSGWRWSGFLPYLRASDRTYAADTYADRSETYGGRSVRGGP